MTSAFCRLTETPTPDTIPVATQLLDQLAAWGLDSVFAVPGLQIDPLTQAMAAHPALRAIVANHELAAGYMADGYARASGRPGAVFAIGGPGCANLLGAAITAKADRSPVLFVTGNIPAVAQGRGEFQDGGPKGANDAGQMAAALGDSTDVASAAQLETRLAHAGAQLAGGDAMHLSLTYDVQVQAVPPIRMVDYGGATQTRPLPSSEWMSRERIVLFADADALLADDAAPALARSCGLPLITTLSARGLVDETDPLSVGHLGFMPDPRAEALLDRRSSLRAEAVLYVGSDARWVQRLRQQHEQVLQIAPAALMTWVSSIGPRAEDDLLARRRVWCDEVQQYERSVGPALAYDTLTHGAAIEAIAAAWPSDSCWVVDAGQVRRVAVTRLRCRRPRSLFVAEGMAPMGWSLGAAIGVALAQPQRAVIALLGDGSMRMHGIEVATAARYRLPILYVLFDNQAYGSVLRRMTTPQELAQTELPPVDWASFAKAFGLTCRTVESIDGLHRALRALAADEGPRLLVLRVPAVDAEAYAHPTGIDWQLPDVARSPSLTSAPKTLAASL